MLDLVGQTLAYAGVGLGILVLGFYVLDLLTPGNLGKLVMGGNKNAATLASATLVSLGLILWFAIHFTGAGWDGLDDALVFGLVGVAAQAVGFVIADVLLPGRLADICQPTAQMLRPAAAVAASVQFSVALIICASLT